MSIAIDMRCPLATGCKCGATPKDSVGSLIYLTEELIDAAVNSVAKLAKFKGLLAPFQFAPLVVESLCAGPRAQMPEFSLADFANPGAAFIKISLALDSALYPMLCDCIDCPPLVTCGGEHCWVVTSNDGYPRPGAEDTQRQYHIPPGGDLWWSNGNGYCVGVLNGILITWSDADDGINYTHFQVCDGNGNSCSNLNAISNGGTSVGLCASGPVVPINDPWPVVPPGVADWLGPPACTTSDICTALEYVYQTIRRTEFLAQVAAGPLYGVTADYTFTLPGVNPIVGPLAVSLPRALEALAPVQPSQLVNPTTTVISAPSLVELDGVAYVDLELTTVPDSMGHRGAGDSLVYHVTGNGPGPGWLVLMGQAGILAYYDIRYGEGLEFSVPAVATALALQLSPGVAVTMTTWERHV